VHHLVDGMLTMEQIDRLMPDLPYRQAPAAHTAPMSITPPSPPVPLPTPIPAPPAGDLPKTAPFPPPQQGGWLLPGAAPPASLANDNASIFACCQALAA
jgi:hypothetical protein